MIWLGNLPTREKVAQTIADDLLKSPKDGGNHGAMVPHSAHLDGFIVRGHIDLLSMADAVLELFRVEQ